jgi:hypothetical protein
MKHGPDSITSSSLRPRPGVLIVYRRRECWQPQLLDDARQPEAARAEALKSARHQFGAGNPLGSVGQPLLVDALDHRVVGRDACRQCQRPLRSTA